MHYTCRFFSSTNTDQLFSHYWENEPDDPAIFSQKGHLFGLVSINNLTAKNTTNTGNKIISQINQTYFTLSNHDFKTQLKNTLDSINDLWHDQNPTILLVAINQDQLAATGIGQFSLYLKRKTKFSNILKASADQTSFITGPIKHQDLLFLTTPDFVNKLPNIKNLLSLENLNSQEDYIRDTIDQFPTCSLLVKVNQDESDSITIPTPIQPESVQSDPVLSQKAQKVIKLNFLSKIFSKKSITISPKDINIDKKRKKINLILISISFIALSVSIFVGYQKKQVNNRRQLFIQLETQTQTNLDNISKVKQLSLEDALTLAEQTKQLVDQMSALDVDPDKVNSFQSQIDSILSQTGSNQLSALDQFQNTSLITDSPSFSNMIFAQDKLYLLDVNKNRIDSVSVDTKANQSISQDNQISQTTKIISLSDNLYALQKDAIYLVKKSNWIKALDLTDLNIISVESWGSSIYLLSASTIYKATLQGQTFSQPVVWLDSDQIMPQNVISLSIDGKIWVLSKQAKIVPYLRGVRDNFKLNQPPQTDTALNLIVATDLDIVAFLPNPNSLVVYTKTGHIISKYNFGDQNILSVALDESTQTIYALSTDQNIYKLTL